MRVFLHGVWFKLPKTTIPFKPFPTHSNHVSFTKFHSNSTITTTHHVCDGGSFFLPHQYTLLYGGSFLGGFVNVHHHHPKTIAANNYHNKMDALHDHHHKGKVIWDFSQQMMVHSSKASSSKSPSPFSLSNEYGLVMSEYHRDTNQKSVQQKMKVLKVNMDINITNDNIIKAQWTPEQDMYIYVAIICS